MGITVDLNKPIEFIPPDTIVVPCDRGYRMIILTKEEYDHVEFKYRRILASKGFTPSHECRNEHGVYDYDKDFALRRSRGIN